MILRLRLICARARAAVRTSDGGYSVSSWKTLYALGIARMQTVLITWFHQAPRVSSDTAASGHTTLNSSVALV